MKSRNVLQAAFCLTLVFAFVFADLAMPAQIFAAKYRLNKTKLTLYVKKKATLKVKGAKKVKWSSSKKAVAKVSSKGVVTAVKKGSATITAKVGKKKLTCKVTVKNPTISAAAATLDVGATTKLTVKNAVGAVKWSSSDDSIASVSDKGLVTGVRGGEATITAVASGVKLNCKVSVNYPELSARTLVLSIGSTRQLTLSHVVTAITWTSSDPEVATVSEDGLVKALKAGTAEITAETSGVRLSCTVTVKEPTPVDPDATISVHIATEPSTLDPGKVVSIDQAILMQHLFSGLARYDYKGDGKKGIIPDMAESLPEPVKNSNGTYTYTYKIRSDAKWSDGVPVKAQDFVYAWNRVLTNEYDYSYMFEIVDGYDSFWEDGGAKKLNMEAVDDSTLKVTANAYYVYWNEFIAHPCAFPVRKDIVNANENWYSDPATCVSNGMYTLSSWENNSAITMAKNPDHPNASNVIMPNIRFDLTRDDSDVLTKYRSGELDFIARYGLDELTDNEISKIQTEGVMGTYFLMMNVNEDLSPTGGSSLTKAQQDEVRAALSLLIDRDHIVNDIVNGGQIPASSLVPIGITEPDGTEFYEKAGNSSDHIGYWYLGDGSKAKNKAAAMEILKKYYTVKDNKVANFPELTYICNVDSTHETIAQNVKSTFAEVGITVTVKPYEWNNYTTALVSGDFTFARLGWISDFNDAVTFLDMWRTDADYNYGGIGTGSYSSAKIYTLDLSDVSGYTDKSVTNGTWAETYDVLISYIQNEHDLNVRNQLLHKAEDLLMQTGAICPLYYYTDIFLLSDNVSGFYASPYGGKYFMYTRFED